MYSQIFKIPSPRIFFPGYIRNPYNKSKNTSALIIFINSMK